MNTVAIKHLHCTGFYFSLPTIYPICVIYKLLISILCVCVQWLREFWPNTIATSISICVPFYRLVAIYSHRNFDMIIMTLLRWSFTFMSILETMFIFTSFIRNVVFIASKCWSMKATLKKHIIFFSFAWIDRSIEVHGWRTVQHGHVSLQPTDQVTATIVRGSKYDFYKRVYLTKKCYELEFMWT